MYTASAMFGSVIIVAGFEFTKVTDTPSSRKEVQAWLPLKSNSAACPITIGPEPMSSTFPMSALFGILLGRTLGRLGRHMLRPATSVIWSKNDFSRSCGPGDASG